MRRAAPGPEREQAEQQLQQELAARARVRDIFSAMAASALRSHTALLRRLFAQHEERRPGEIPAPLLKALESAPEGNEPLNHVPASSTEPDLSQASELLLGTLLAFRQGSPVVSDWACYKAAVEGYRGTSSCQPLDQEDLGHLRLFANLCNAGVAPADIRVGVLEACASRTVLPRP